MGSQTQYYTFRQLVSSLIYNKHVHTSENNLRKHPLGKQNFSTLLEFVHSWDHHFYFPLESKNLKVKVSCKFFFKKQFCYLILFALRIIINNKWSLCKLNKNKNYKELGKISNFIDRMVVCEWRDFTNNYKVWKMVIYNRKYTLRYNDQYPP